MDSGSSMLSCAPAAGMPLAPHAAHAQWAALLNPPTVKSEPVESMDEASFTKEQASGFYSEGFHSASPSGSSKDSTGHSPRSVGSGGEPFYEQPLHAKANLGMHLDAYHAGLPYSLLTPPGFDPRPTDRRDSPPDYQPGFSPNRVLQPSHISTPHARADATPPKSPLRTPASPDADANDRRNFHDSGYDVSQGLKDSEDGHDGSGLDDEFDEEPGLRVPAVNSHGKVKTFKCKQCEFVAVTKLSFWEHSKEHIKPEKMLNCPKCPFVTEYKHHLEYHMRNHFGSKPFQCSQCSYSCVNKSMLNSHLKSHSNVYQYRCADCNYATKYCHSLKLHLRKYQHNPAMVLNIDGTPNPFPIIDVYGTRRGPKQKPLSKLMEQQNAMNNNHSQPPAPTHPLFRNHFPINLPYLPPLLPQSFLFPPNNNYENKTSPRPSDAGPERQQSVTPPSILQQRLSYERMVNNGAASPPVKSPASQPRTPPAMPARESPAAQPDDALDLTNTKTSEAGSPPPADRPVPLTPTTALKNRRKGRAYKLQPAALRLQHDEEKRDMDMSGSESDASAEAPRAAAPSAYSCQFCDITFGDLTMHTIHMGFHGYKDPFMCNKCGERSADRVAFYIHLGRAQHA